MTEASAEKSTATKQEVAHILMSLGITPSHKGYRYLLDGLMFVLNTPERCFFTVGEVYSYLDARYKEGFSRIERCMRHAIEIAWKENTRLWQDSFGLYLMKGAKPSNSFFLATFVELYRLDMLCCYEDEEAGDNA